MTYAYTVLGEKRIELAVFHLDLGLSNKWIRTGEGAYIERLVRRLTILNTDTVFGTDWFLS